MQNHNYLQLQPFIIQIKILLAKLDAVNNYIFFYIEAQVLFSNLTYKGISIFQILANDI